MAPSTTTSSSPLAGSSASAGAAGAGTSTSTGTFAVQLTSAQARGQAKERERSTGSTGSGSESASKPPKAALGAVLVSRSGSTLYPAGFEDLYGLPSPPSSQRAKRVSRIVSPFPSTQAFRAQGLSRETEQLVSLASGERKLGGVLTSRPTEQQGSPQQSSGEGTDNIELSPSTSSSGGSGSDGSPVILARASHVPFPSRPSSSSATSPAPSTAATTTATFAPGHRARPSFVHSSSFRNLVSPLGLGISSSSGAGTSPQLQPKPSPTPSQGSTMSASSSLSFGGGGQGQGRKMPRSARIERRPPGGGGGARAAGGGGGQYYDSSSSSDDDASAAKGNNKRKSMPFAPPPPPAADPPPSHPFPPPLPLQGPLIRSSSFAPSITSLSSAASMTSQGTTSGSKREEALKRDIELQTERIRELQRKEREEIAIKRKERRGTVVNGAMVAKEQEGEEDTDGSSGSGTGTDSSSGSEEDEARIEHASIRTASSLRSLSAVSRISRPHSLHSLSSPALSPLQAPATPSAEQQRTADAWRSANAPVVRDRERERERDRGGVDEWSQGCLFWVGSGVGAASGAGQGGQKEQKEGVSAGKGLMRDVVPSMKRRIAPSSSSKRDSTATPTLPSADSTPDLSSLSLLDCSPEIGIGHSSSMGAGLSALVGLGGVTGKGLKEKSSRANFNGLVGNNGGSNGGKKDSAGATGAGWKRVTSVIREDGLFQVFSEDQVLLSSLSLHTLSRTDIRPVDPSVLGRPHVVAVYRRNLEANSASPVMGTGARALGSFASTVTTASTATIRPPGFMGGGGGGATKEEPVYLCMPTLVAAQVWLVVSHCYAKPDLYPPPSSSSGASGFTTFGGYGTQQGEKTPTMGAQQQQQQGQGEGLGRRGTRRRFKGRVGAVEEEEESSASEQEEAGGERNSNNDERASPAPSFLSRSSQRKAPPRRGGGEKKYRVFRSLSICVNEGRGLGELAALGNSAGSSGTVGGGGARTPGMMDGHQSEGAGRSVSLGSGSGGGSGGTASQRASLEEGARPSTSSSSGGGGHNGGHEKHHRQVQGGEWYAEVELDGDIVARTSLRRGGTGPGGQGQGNNNPVWSETFSFFSLPAFRRPVQLYIYHLPSRSSSSSSRAQATAIGYASFDPADLPREETSEKWWSVRPMPGDPRGFRGLETLGEVALRVEVGEEVLLPRLEYEVLEDLLVEDADASLAIELAASHPSDLEDIANLLLRIFIGQGVLLPRLHRLVEHEVSRDGDTPAILFRGNSLLTKTVELYMRMVAEDYLDASIGEPIRRLVAGRVELEIDPARLRASGKDLAAHIRELREWTNTVWNSIYEARHKCPLDLRHIFRYIQTFVVQKFGEAPKSVRSTSVSAFIFLRFLVPAVLNPQLFGLVRQTPDIKTKRSLTLIAKTLQGLANFSSFGTKEPWMVVMNPFLKENTAACVDFIAHIATPLPSKRFEWTSPSAAQYLVPYRLRNELPVLQREGVPLLPHLLDVGRDLGLLAALVTRATIEKGLPDFLDASCVDSSSASASASGGAAGKAGDSKSIGGGGGSKPSAKYQELVMACSDAYEEASRRGEGIMSPLELRVRRMTEPSSPSSSSSALAGQQGRGMRTHQVRGSLRHSFSSSSRHDGTPGTPPRATFGILPHSPSFSDFHHHQQQQPYVTAAGSPRSPYTRVSRSRTISSTGTMGEEDLLGHLGVSGLDEDIAAGLRRPSPRVLPSYVFPSRPHVNASLAVTVTQEQTTEVVEVSSLLAPVMEGEPSSAGSGSGAGAGAGKGIPAQGDELSVLKAVADLVRDPAGVHSTAEVSVVPLSPSTPTTTSTANVLRRGSKASV